MAAILDRFPDEVTVTVVDPTGQVVLNETVRPTYVRSRPNGQGCPPECLSARVVLGV